MTEKDSLAEADRDLVSAVERYIERVGLQRTGLIMTDVMVVTVRQGFDPEGGKSQTSVFAPTETSAIPTLIGMARFASLLYEGMAASTFPPNKDKQ